MGYPFQAILTKIFIASPFLVERASHHHKLAYSFCIALKLFWKKGKRYGYVLKLFFIASFYKTTNNKANYNDQYIDVII